MNSTTLQFSAAVSTGEPQPKKPIFHRIKGKMLSEFMLIASNLKIFLATLGVASLAAADMVVEPKSLEDWGLKGCLIVAILILARVIAVQNKKIESLYERLSEKEDEEESGGHPRRHRK